MKSIKEIYSPHQQNKLFCVACQCQSPSKWLGVIRDIDNPILKQMRPDYCPLFHNSSSLSSSPFPTHPPSVQTAVTSNICVWRVLPHLCWESFLLFQVFLELKVNCYENKRPPWWPKMADRVLSILASKLCAATALRSELI